MNDSPTRTLKFRDLALKRPLLEALEEIGYEQPSPIQEQAIPTLLEGSDLIGRAPTGTGKTAAFALPLLCGIDLRKRGVQALVLTPTRELAIQVSEAITRYATRMKELHVLPVYGGQNYTTQIRQLSRGVQVVVGTPGRLMDHMRKGTLKLDVLRMLVLDEADEMLRMGFIDDVEWILEQLPAERQTALFSATMPREIRKIARRYMNEPPEITVEGKSASADTIRQRYWLVSGVHKLDALTRLLEVETFDAMLVFVRTKTATTELAERLEARGYSAAALNGDMVQRQREQIVERFRRGTLQILVATDVAARGLDVERVSHVVNYDIPYDTDSYIHRIGRTGRAGRTGEAILFVAPRERRMLHAIEKATRKRIEPLTLPSTEMVNNSRVARFMETISKTIADGELDEFRDVLAQYQKDHEMAPLEVAAALAKLYLGDRSLRLDISEPPKESTAHRSSGRKDSGRKDAGRNDSSGSRKRVTQDRPRKSRERSDVIEAGMARYRVEVGAEHGVKAGNIVGAIANEAAIDSEYIGRIDIHDRHSFVDLPEGMPRAIQKELRGVWVCGQRLALSRADGTGDVAKSSEFSSKPTSDSSGKPGSKPFRKSSAGASEKPTSRSFRKPGGSSSSKPASKSFGKPAGNSSAKPAAKPFGKSASSSAAKPASKPFKKPAGSSSKKSGSEDFGKSTDGPSARPASKPAGKRTTGTLSKSTSASSGKPSGGSSSTSSSKPGGVKSAGGPPGKAPKAKRPTGAKKKRAKKAALKGKPVKRKPAKP